MVAFIFQCSFLIHFRSVPFFPTPPNFMYLFILTTYQAQLMLSLYAWVRSHLLEKSQPNRHHILEETVSPSRCHQESIALKHRDLWKPIFLSLSADCPDSVKLLWRQLQFVWVHEYSSSVVFKRHSFASVFPDLWLLQSCHPLFHNSYWALGCVWDRCLICSWTFTWHTLLYFDKL